MKSEATTRAVESWLEKRGGEANSAELRHYFCDKPSLSKKARSVEEVKRNLDRPVPTSLPDVYYKCAYPWLLKEVLGPMVRRGILYVMPRLGEKGSETWYILTKEARDYLKLANAWAKMEEMIVHQPAFKDVNPGILAYSHLTRAWQIASTVRDPEIQKIRRALEREGGYVDNVYEKLPKGAELIASTETEEERKQRENFYKETGGTFTVNFPSSLEDEIARAVAFENACIAGVAAARQVKAELEIQLLKRKES